MTVEGEKDDITGLGQTEAAHAMVRLPDERRRASSWPEASGTTASSTARAGAP